MKPKTIKTIMMAYAVILIIGVLANLYTFTVPGTPLFQTLTSVGLVLTAGFGAVYILTGYSKDKSAVYFTCFMAMYAVTEWFGVIGAKNLVTANMLLLVLSFGCSCVLTFAKDLGMVKSITFSSIIIITVIGRLVISNLTTGLPVFGIRPLTKLVLGFTVQILVLAKYYDKKERHRV